MKGQIFITFGVLMIALSVILYANWFKPYPDYVEKISLKNINSEIREISEFAMLNSSVESTLNNYFNFLVENVRGKNLSLSIVYCYVNDSGITLGNFIKTDSDFNLTITDGAGKRSYDFGSIAAGASEFRTLTPNGDYTIQISYQNPDKSDSFTFSGSPGEQVVSLLLDFSIYHKSGKTQILISRTLK